ncbi:response regulator [Lachnospiraceae bacterium ASD3451]|uniref:response regulator transcription factor n=1 Tax=Diplocloster agilis TaxID=2850323 RepID=UPI001D8AC3B5|nr:response regulator [Diplocloster agilis]MBU9743139.1 response regulator [Diplocloster agilis]
MLKIMIVDDELPIREWIEYVIRETGLPVEIVGIAANGRDAMECFRQHRPQLVFTDIKMPMMDGIELLRQIKLAVPQTMVVMLTSHNDFEYARDSLNYNADQFILKTEITKECLREIISGCMKKAGEQPAAAPVPKAAAGDYIRFTPGELNQWIAQEGLAVPSGPYFILTYEAAPEFGPLSVKLGEQCAESFSLVIREHEWKQGYHAAVFYLPASSSRLYLYDVFEKVAGQMSELLARPIGTSGPVTEGLEFAEELSVSLLLHNMRFYEEEDAKISAHAPFRYQASAKTYHVWQDTLQKSFQEIIYEISSQRFHEAQSKIKLLLSYLETEHPPQIYQIRKIFREIINNYKLIALGQGFSNTEKLCHAAISKLKSAGNFREFKEHIYAFLSGSTISFLNTYSGYSEYVKAAITRVRKDYAAIEKISDITDVLNINQEYFCRLFKNEVGISFNKYLTNYRLKIAEELLKNTDRKVSDIARQVGYQNLSYFSKIFKEKYNTNPYKYRTGDDA